MILFEDEKHGTSFTTEQIRKAVTELYGAWKEKTMYGKKTMGVVRSTYLIDEKGKIAKAMSNVKAADNPEDMLEMI